MLIVNIMVQDNITSISVGYANKVSVRSGEREIYSSQVNEKGTELSIFYSMQ